MRLNHACVLCLSHTHTQLPTCTHKHTQKYSNSKNAHSVSFRVSFFPFFQGLCCQYWRVCKYVCHFISNLYVQIYVSLYACTFVYLCVCMYVYIFMFVFKYVENLNDTWKYMCNFQCMSACKSM